MSKNGSQLEVLCIVWELSPIEAYTSNPALWWPIFLSASQDSSSITSAAWILIKILLFTFISQASRIHLQEASRSSRSQEFTILPSPLPFNPALPTPFPFPPLSLIPFIFLGANIACAVGLFLIEFTLFFSTSLWLVCLFFLISQAVVSFFLPL